MARQRGGTGESFPWIVAKKFLRRNSHLVEINRLHQMEHQEQIRIIHSFVFAAHLSFGFSRSASHGAQTQNSESTSLPFK